ncbi:hypothetical protein [Sphingomonas sp. ERG5]|uniref:hypothetical protein n=1 Tax=Sphingomonas sp. ERG5 TaxID=1381597 RepID=UPI00054C5D8B|nr:hypothetical protein [Sphingomonas sp. ERG5]
MPYVTTADGAEDSKKIDVPCQSTGVLSATLVQQPTLKIYPGFPHGMCTTHPEVINPDLLAFIKG